MLTHLYIETKTSLRTTRACMRALLAHCSTLSWSESSRSISGLRTAGRTAARRSWSPTTRISSLGSGTRGRCPCAQANSPM